MPPHKSEAEDSRTIPTLRRTVVFAALSGLLGLASAHRTAGPPAGPSVAILPSNAGRLHSYEHRSGLLATPGSWQPGLFMGCMVPQAEGLHLIDKILPL